MLRSALRVGSLGARCVRASPPRALTAVSQRRSVHQSSVQCDGEEPVPSPASATFDPHSRVAKIVDEIGKLNLLEVRDLNALLKERFNIADAPVMMAGGGGMGGGMAAGGGAQEEEVVEVKEQTEFAVKLESFDAASKVKLIREIKSLVPDMTLVTAKKFVEGAPNTVKEKATKAEAEELKAALEKAGGVVKIE